MSTQYNIGRQLTKAELDYVASHINVLEVEQDADGNVDARGRMVTAEQIKEALGAGHA